MASLRSWHWDRWALLRYRLAAARYGLQIRMMRPVTDVLAVIGTILTVATSVAAIAAGYPRPVLLALGVCAVGGAWPFIRYLGSLSVIMRTAASNDAAARRVRADIEAGMRNEWAHARLREIYDPIITRAAVKLEQLGWGDPPQLLTAPDGTTSRRTYAAVVFGLGKASNLDNLLCTIVGELRAPKAERVTESRQRLIQRWATLDGRADLADETGSNYCLAGIHVEADPEPRICLDVTVSEYGRIARTSEALVNEFGLFAYITLRMAKSAKSMRSSTVLICLPWRRSTHSRAADDGDILLKPVDRGAGLGVAVATLVRDNGNGGHLRALVAKRSGRVGTYPNALHVIPAGNCNTHGTDFGGARVVPSWYLRTKMRCEFLEEWHGEEDLERSTMPDWRAAVDARWKAAIPEADPIVLTGLAIDLLNLRPEVCAAVVVARDRINAMPGLNYEWEGREPPRWWTLVDVVDAEPSRLVQSGAAALILALCRDGQSG